MGREKMRSMEKVGGLWVGLMKVCHRRALVQRRILEGRHQNGRERGLDIISGCEKHGSKVSRIGWCLVRVVGEQCDE
jgi:hypothetical protein